jgi:hypothetical protein
MKRRVRG